MVADRVEVTSRKAGSEEALHLGLGRRRRSSPSRRPTRETAGTDVVLHMKADADEYLEPIRLEAIVRKWADHITLPITIARDGKDQPANEGTALWRKPRAEVTRAVVQRILPPSRPSVRHALGHAALARRGHAGILRAAVHPRHEAVRAVRGRSRVACAAACAAHVHHRQGRAAAVLAALRAGRGGYRGPAAERLARDAADHAGARRGSARR